MASKGGFDAVVDRVAAFLGHRGFSRRSAVFFRMQGGNWAVIELQKSQRTSSDVVVFTVNVGVVSSRLAHFSSAPLKNDRPPQSSEWHWRQRLGFLLAGQDKWWTIGPRISPEQVSREIEDALELALPEVEKYVQDEALRDVWLTGSSPGLTDVQRLRNLAVLLKALGPAGRLSAVLEDLRRLSRANAVLLERKLQARLE